MNKLAYKFAAGMATATVALGLFAGSAFAAGDITCTISGNGHHSRNACIILVGRRAPRDVVQINRARVFNGVLAVAATGGNTANGNTTGSGDVSIDSGDATVTVTITNTINQNTPPTP